MALCRNGELEEAHGLLTRGLELAHGRDERTAQLLAITCAQLDRQDEALEWVARAREWGSGTRPQDDELSALLSGVLSDWER